MMKIFLVQVTESSDNELLFSLFTQQDSTLNQASNPTQVEKMVVIQKESSNWEQFDSAAALTIWGKQKQTRRIKLPSTNYILQPKQKKNVLKSLRAIKDPHIKRKDRFFKSFSKIDEENFDNLEPIGSVKDSSDSEYKDGEYSNHNLYCESTADITIDQQPQALVEIQDENQEDELLTETKYTEEVPRKKVKYTSQCLTVNKKKVLKHLSHLHSVLLTSKKEKVRQTYVKSNK